jgi:EAL domain-containing protein (putative c-di-GMP-specific phosphodiesterase class I)
VAYQPIVRTRDRRVVAVEALLRWTQPDRGAVAPLTMVAVAEQSGLINDVGQWVLEQACHERQQWSKAYPANPLDIAINVSARQLVNPSFCATLIDTLAATRTDPNALLLELTENVLIEDSENVRRALGDIKDVGVRLALDDFGTGYSSMSYLRHLPIDILKIDQGFIADIGEAPSGSAIIRAITNLAHTLGLTVTAEGVETQRQHDEITAAGCLHAQGYLYSAPMPAAEISALLEATSSGSDNRAEAVPAPSGAPLPPDGRTFDIDLRDGFPHVGSSN